ncbi:MAG: Stk1 family PASTA domain-containing Ser/Thr kinase [Clostridiaceae bacterium]
MKGLTLANRYEVVEKIGEGGMAFVYKAKDLKLNRLVAVKVLRSEFASDKDFLEKFKDEAMSAASINDSNIVSIYDVGSEDSLNYIIMEYINGTTLKDLINSKGALPYKIAIDIASKIAKALDSAHKNNIVHRDIKPHNILVTDTGDVKVTDFGIAKSNTSATIVNTNKVIGSVHYISPEQAKGSVVDRRSDIYSLGVVMYEMVTGKLPFDADTPVSVAIKHIQDDVTEPKDVNKELPESMNYLILKTLEKDPLLRYQTAYDLYMDLLNIKNGTFVSIKPKSDEHTILMKPIDNTMISKAASNNIKDKYRKIEDLSEEDDEEEDDYAPVKTSKAKNNGSISKENSKKSKKILLTTIGVVVFMLIAIGTFYLGSRIAGVSGNDVTLVDVTNMTEEEAKQKIESLGLVSEVAEVSNNELEAGKVYATNPQPNSKVKKGSTVKLYISSGPKLEENYVQNLVNLDLNLAKSIIENNGFVVGKVEEAYSDSIPVNQIISQSPAANTKLEKGGKIDLVVSKGPSYSNYNLVGKTAEEAKTILSADGINLNVTIKNSSNEADKEKDGKIVDQDKTKAKKGDTINVTVIKYTQATLTIDSSKILNAKLSAAKKYLSSLGLTYEVVFEDDSAIGLSEDKLIVKDFSPKTGVKKGDKITLTVVKKE